MKNKKILSIILSLICLFSIGLIFAFRNINKVNVSKAYAEESLGNLVYVVNLDNKSYSVKASDVNISGEIIISENYNGLPVTNIMDNGFKDCKGITSITLPTTIKKIGRRAFEGCGNIEIINVSTLEDWLEIDFVSETSNPMADSSKETLYVNGEEVTNIVVPEDIIELKSNVFNGYENLTNIELPSTIENIGASAFKGCKNIESVCAPSLDIWLNIKFSNVTSNPMAEATNESLYINETLVTEIELPEITKIKNYTFYGFNGLTKISLPGTIKNIGTNVFFGCENIEEIYIPSTDIWMNINFATASSNPMAGSNKEGLYLTDGTLVTITEFNPETETILKPYVFYNYEKLTELTIGDKVVGIGKYAFADCTGITDLTIGSGLTGGVDSAMFGGCVNLKSLSINSNPLDGAFKDSVLTFLYVDEFVTSIGKDAFKNSNIIQLVIATRALTIDKEMFGGSEKLLDLTTDSAVKANGFSGVTTLKYLSLGQQGYVNEDDEYIVDLMDIGDSAFANCYNLEEISTIGIYNFGEDVFKGCSKVNKILIKEKQDWFKNTFSNEYSNPMFDTTSEELYYKGLNLNEYLIDESALLGVQEIQAYGFAGYSKFESLDLSSATSIGSYAFMGCSNLTEVANLKTISTGIFKNCLSLSSVVLQNNVTNVSKEAFYGCSSLTSIDLPVAVTEINESAFESSGLSGELTLSDTITMVGNNAFKNCESITSLKSNVQTISDGAFYSCGKLTTVEMLDSDTTDRTIGEYVFDGCSISTLYIGTGYASTYVQKSKFGNCPSLTTLTINSPLTWAYAFSGLTNLTDVTINVEKIGTSVFKGSLTTQTGVTDKIVRLNNVTRIENDAFKNCTGITKIYTPSLDEWCGITFASTTANPMNASSNEGLYLNGQTTKVTEVTLGSSAYKYIKNYTFYGYENLEEVTITNHVVSVGAQVFDGCEIKSLDIGSGFTNYNTSENKGAIDKEMFGGCASVTHLTINSNPFYFKNSMSCRGFEDLENLTHLKLGNNVTYIWYAFDGCYNITNLEVGNGFNISNNAQICVNKDQFAGCENLTHLTLNSNPSTFRELEKLTSVTLLNNVTDLGIYDSDPDFDTFAFTGCENITDLKVLTKNSIIENWGFYTNYESLQTLTIYSNTISHTAFNNIKSLQTITFGNVGNISYTQTIVYDNYWNTSAFQGCSSISAIYVPSLDYWLKNMLFINDASANPMSVSDCEALYLVGTDRPISTVEINPTTATTINNYAFYDYGRLNHLTLGDNVTGIGTDAFTGCSSIITLSIGSGLTNVSKSMFGGCENLTRLTINSPMVNNAFSNCDELGTLMVNTEIIPNHAFASCFKKETINASTLTLGSNVKSIGDSAFSDCTYLSSVTIPSTVTTIENYAFFVTGLTSITIPSTITTIGDYAFYQCSKLISVTFNTTQLTEISEGLFGECSSLRSVTIPSSVTSIGAIAFWGTGLTSITIPSAVTNIGNSAFENCLSLTKATIEDSLSNETRFIGTNVFGMYDSNNECPLTELYIGSGFESVSKDNIGGCERLQTLTLNSNVAAATYNSTTEMYSGGFTELYDLHDVTIGDGVNIGEYAFGKTSTSTNFTYFVEVGKDIYIKADAFRGFSSASNPLVVTVTSLSDWCSIDFDSIYSNPMSGDAYDKIFKIGNSNAGVSEITSLDFYANNITEIDRYSFAGFTSVTEVILTGVQTIGYAAFSNCSYIESIKVNSLNDWMNISFATANSNPMKVPDNETLYVNGAELTTLTTNCEIIKSYAFNGYEKLTEVKLLSGVKGVGGHAFAYCENLERIYFPCSIGCLFESSGPTIGQYAVSHCGDIDVYRCMSMYNEMISNDNDKWNDWWYALGTNKTNVFYGSTVTYKGWYCHSGTTFSYVDLNNNESFESNKQESAILKEESDEIIIVDKKIG